MKSTTSNIASRTAGQRLRGVAGALVGVTLLFTAAACGSDDESDDTTASSSENEESTDTESTDTESTDTESSDEESSDTEQDSGDSMDSGDYCGKIQEFGTSIMENSSAMTDPNAAGELVDAYREIADVAPADHAGDWNAVADAMELLSDLDVSDPDSMEELEQIDLEGPTQAIMEHVQEACA